MLDTFTIAPLPRATIGPRAAWVSRRTAVTSTSRRDCSCSTVFSRNLCLSPRPALFTSRSTGRSGSASRACGGRVGAREPGLDQGQCVPVTEVGDHDLRLDVVRLPQLGGELL